jgi:hypothetical protein
MESHCKEKQRTNSMEPSPSWQATPEIPSILFNPKGPYRVHRSPPTTGPYPEPDESSSYLLIPFL